MTMRFDHNNNSEECQMFFDKINNGSPFRVITFIGPILSHFKNVMRKGLLKLLLDLAKACFLYMKTSQVRHSI